MERRFSAYHARPLSVRSAMKVIVTATAGSVIIGGILIRVAEPQLFTSVWLGMWWALQTVTTVGYGDIVPKSPLGRAVGGFVMLEAIAFVSIITAVITSSFVTRAQHELSEGHPILGPRGEAIRDIASSPPAPAGTADTGAPVDLAQRLDEIASRLDRIEEALARQSEGHDPTPW
jgi:voltage-gated potassium channel